MQYLTYIFCGEYVVANAEAQLPVFEQHPNDLCFTPLQGINHEPISAERVLVRHVTSDDRARYLLPQGYEWYPFRQLLSQWSMAEFEQAARAKQLLEWHLNHQFCCRCGQPTDQHRLEMAMICRSCRYRQYPRISPCVITLIRQDSKILLARGKRSTGYYGLIAGFVEVGETLEQAVQRETLEEVGIQIDHIRYIGSQPWPFPSNLMLGFEAHYRSGQLQLQADEIADAQFFDIDHLPLLPQRGSIAYRMIMNAVAAIRNEQS